MTTSDDRIYDDSAPRALVICGRVFGTYTGWDGELDCITFYDYVPSTMASLRGLTNGDIVFDFVRGLLIYTNDAGEETRRIDAVPIMAVLPRKVGL